MIDFVKFRIPNLNQDKLEEKFEFTQEVSIKTAEFVGPKKAQYRNLLIKIFRNHIEISGSIHKFWNIITLNEEQNHDRFKYTQLENCLDHLAEELYFDLSMGNIMNMEYGVNIVTPKNPTRILKENLKAYDYIPLEDANQCSKKGYLVEFILSNYFVKVYDKGRQFKLPKNLMRLEIRTRKSVDLHKTNIQNLADLKNRTKLVKLGQLLDERISKLLIVNKAQSDMSQKEKAQIKTQLDMSYWQDTKRSSYSTRRRNKKRFEGILDKYGCFRLRNIIINKVKRKWSYLLTH